MRTEIDNGQAEQSVESVAVTNGWIKSGKETPKISATVVLAEDHVLVREGLKLLLRSDPALRVVGEARDGLAAVQLVEQHRPTLLVLDLMLPRLHGLEVIRQVNKLKTTKVLVVSMHAEHSYVVEALRGGAAGYVLKESTSDEFLKALRAVRSGQTFLSAALADVALNARLKELNGRASDPYDALTSRERLVLQLAAEGLTSGQIGKTLFISRRTAETHRANIMRKLWLQSQTDLVRFAIRRQIVSA